MRISAIGQPHVAVLIETHVLTDAPADKGSRQLVEFGRIGSLAGRIRRQVVLDVQRLPEPGFIERHFLVDPNHTRLRVRSEVLDQICQQLFAVLPRETQSRRSIAEEPFRIGGGRAIEERGAHHAVDAGSPRGGVARPGGEEVFPVTDQAGAFRHVSSGPCGVNLVVAPFLDRGVGRGLRRAERQLHLRVVPSLQGQLLDVRYETLRGDADLIIARKEVDRAELAGVRVHQVQDALVHVADGDLCSLERCRRLDRSRETRRARQSSGLNCGRRCGNPPVDAKDGTGGCEAPGHDDDRARRL